MKKQAIKTITLLIISLLLCSCTNQHTNESETSVSPATITDTSGPTPTPHLDIPAEEQLIQCYTDALSKLTDSAILSSTYNNFESSSSGSGVEIIINMSDGKTLKTTAFYFPDSKEWQVASILNHDNSHSYCIPGVTSDIKLLSKYDFYDYTTDKKIPIEQFTNPYTLGKMKFQFSADWKKVKGNKKQFIFRDNKKLYTISVFTSKAPIKSIDKIWRLLSTRYDSYSLKDESSLKIGGKKAKQWKFSYEQGLDSYEAMTTMVIYKQNAYFIMWISQFGLEQFNSPAYESLLENITWKK